MEMMMQEHLFTKIIYGQPVLHQELRWHKTPAACGDQSAPIPHSCSRRAIVVSCQTSSACLPAAVPHHTAVLLSL